MTYKPSVIKPKTGAAITISTNNDLVVFEIGKYVFEMDADTALKVGGSIHQASMSLGAVKIAAVTGKGVA